MVQILEDSPEEEIKTSSFENALNSKLNDNDDDDDDDEIVIVEGGK